MLNIKDKMMSIIRRGKLYLPFRQDAESKYLRDSIKGMKVHGKC